jgi:hypothetical protein
MTPDNDRPIGAEELGAAIRPILDSLEQVKKDLSSRKRDKWDAMGLIAQFVSAVFLGGASVAMTYYTQVYLGALSAQVAVGQLKNSQNQLSLEFLKAVADAHNDPGGRAAFIAASVIAIPDQAALVARYYAVADGSDQVREAAIKVLGQQQARADLQTIIDSGRLPDLDLARTALGEAVRNVRMRISEVDDVASANVNGEEVLRATFGQDSGWHEVTQKFKPGKNEVIFKLENVSGGYGVRFQLLGGGQRYDSGSIAANGCPCNAPVLEIRFQVDVALDSTVLRITPAQTTHF